MDLWVRSQDKECLMKVNRIDYDYSNSEHRIMVNGFETLVAEYETKRRALEVLGEIQNFIRERYFLEANQNFLNLINENSINIGIKIIERSEKLAVYQMPEK